jgi:hypothetical protein
MAGTNFKTYLPESMSWKTAVFNKHVRPRCPATALSTGWETEAEAEATVAMGYKVLGTTHTFFFLSPLFPQQNGRDPQNHISRKLWPVALKTIRQVLMVRRTLVSDTCLRSQIHHCTQPKPSFTFTYDLG